MKKILFILLILVITACSNQTIIEPEQKSNLTVGVIKTKIIEGRTTQDEIMNLFGAPNIITTNTEGKEVWNYNKSSYQSGAQGKSSGWSLLLAGNSKSSVVSTSSTASMDLIIIFNKQGIVERYKVISASF